MRKLISVVACISLAMVMLSIGSTSVLADSHGKKVMAMEAWVRAVPPSAKNSAAYMMLKNSMGKDVTLVEVSTEVAKTVEIHEVVKSGGMMEMRPLKGGLTIPAGKSVMLQPGGFHIMMIDLTQKLMEGHKVSLTLKFSDGSQVKVSAPVKQGEGMKMGGMDKKH